MLARGKVRDTEGLKKVAVQWTSYMTDRFRGKIVTEKKMMLDFANQHMRSTAIFVTLDKNSKIIEIEGGMVIDKNKQGNVVVIPEEPIFLAPIGDGQHFVQPLEWGVLEQQKLIDRQHSGDPTAYRVGYDLHLGKTEDEVSNAAKSFIEDAEKDYPAQVGRPVDVILLDPQGTHWVHVKPKCDIDVIKAK